jgi:RimJ/RimL family protein N-acetyltransferase
VIETRRLCLRPLTLNDIDLLLSLDNDPEVMRWLNGGTPVSRDEMREIILPRLLQASIQPPGIGVHVAQLRATGESIGWFGIFPPTPPRSLPAFGVRLAAAYWGAGYGFEGSRALIDHTFSPTFSRTFAPTFAKGDVSAIEATTYEANLGSRGLLRRLGFVETERFRYQPDDTARATFVAAGSAPWPGEDLRFTLNR